MKIKRCERNEYSALLDMLNAAFGHPASGPGAHFFERNVSMATPFIDDASDEMIARHMIAIDGGEVIGCVGAYPCTMLEAGGRRIGAYGIGQVACDSRFRGMGVMTSLMSEQLKDADAQGRSLGFLGGSRHRYKNFGFDFGGFRVDFAFDPKHIDAGRSAMRPMEAADIPALMNMHEKFPVRIERTPEYWVRLLKRENYAGYVSGDLSAYAFALSRGPALDEKSVITEVQGDPSAALALVGDICGKRGERNECGEAKRGKPRNITVQHPYLPACGDPVYNALYSACEHFCIYPACLARVSGGLDAGNFWIPAIDKI